MGGVRNREMVSGQCDMATGPVSAVLWPVIESLSGPTDNDIHLSGVDTSPEGVM